jgi:hypothetical protein
VNHSLLAAVKARKFSRSESKMETEAFSSLIAKGYIEGGSDSAFLKVSRVVLIGLFRPLLEQIHFDENYYRKTNPDLAAAELSGQITSLHDHYLEHGYFENRLPCYVEVDVDFYSTTYPDVGEAILAGRVLSPEWHFQTFGFREGRLPQQGWRFEDLVSR